MKEKTSLYQVIIRSELCWVGSPGGLKCEEGVLWACEWKHTHTHLRHQSLVWKTPASLSSSFQTTRHLFCEPAELVNRYAGSTSHPRLQNWLTQHRAKACQPCCNSCYVFTSRHGRGRSSKHDHVFKPCPVNPKQDVAAGPPVTETQEHRRAIVVALCGKDRRRERRSVIRGGEERNKTGLFSWAVIKRGLCFAMCSFSSLQSLVYVRQYRIWFWAT